jgi:hypothetical protein
MGEERDRRTKVIFGRERMGDWKRRREWDGEGKDDG